MTEEQRIASLVAQDLNEIQRYIEFNVTPGRWPDLEALLRIATTEAAREIEREGQRAIFAATAPDLGPGGDDA